MLPIVWRAQAIDDLETIVSFVAQESPDAAYRLMQKIENAVLPTATHPYLYRMSERVVGLREIVAHPNYIILYRVTASEIEIVNVVHSRQTFP